MRFYENILKYALFFDENCHNSWYNMVGDVMKKISLLIVCLLLCACDNQNILVNADIPITEHVLIYEENEF